MTESEFAASAQMLIRRPVSEVFNAFVDPEITTKFWFTKSSGRVEAGRHLQWEWEMYGVSAGVDVLTVEPHERIVLEWPYGPRATPTTVEFVFTPVADDRTFVTVTNSGFSGAPSEVAEQAIGSTGGFNLVLAGAKALLEHGIQLNLVADHVPPDTQEP